MNDISKTNIKTRLEKALETEGLSTNTAARILGISAPYLSMVKNPAIWDRCSIATWDILLAWVNSGQKLTEYAEKHGKTLPEKKHIELPPKVVAIKPLVKVKPEALERRKKEIEAKEPTITNLAFHQEQAEKANAEIKRLMKENTELIKELNERSIKGTVELKDDCHKFPIDIEINLLINGKKIAL